MRPEPLSWVGLLTLMAHAPDPEPAVRGRIRSVDGRDDSRGHVGWAATAGEPRPVFASVRPPGHDGLVRVWRDGARLRIEEPDGTPRLIVGAEQCWQFRPGQAMPVVAPARAVTYFDGAHLLTRRSADSFAGEDFTRPTGPIGSTTFLGRLAWTVELAPPAHKPYPLQLVVDAETGLVLQQRNDGLGSVDEWVELVVGEPLPASLFGWDGPSRSAEQERARMQAQNRADTSRRSAWFAAHVARLPLRAELGLDVNVHDYDETTGAFQASLGHGHVGLLARRPLTESGSWELGWAEVQHRWSDDRWEWALTLHRDEITPAGLRSLREQLASGSG